MSSNGGSSCSIRLRRTQRKPVPRGPRRNLRPVAESMSQPSSTVERAAGRPTGTRPAAAARRPRASTRPTRRGVDQPAVCRHVDERDELHARRRAAARELRRRTARARRRGRPRSIAPVRAATCSSAIQFEAYSACPSGSGRRARTGTRRRPCPTRGWRSRRPRSRRAPPPTEPGERVVGVLPGVAPLGGRLIAADLGLAAAGARRRRRRPRAGGSAEPGVVQVRHVRAARRFGAEPARRRVAGMPDSDGVGSRLRGMDRVREARDPRDDRARSSRG